ncbi:DUF1059 domain-containing protein [Psychromonas sp. B3M02]|uniref:DUF1059 domain-containing protein n=1 Tax=Psychromonas sp. B3M02 TaxID=2267226 RepID=UPI000DEAD284|nr:DUF1059 domain-containing protein [Psychromonas sp. B3M02]RBW45615.1 DUF1059 domain-containing protein [Psychromonas sp. B3M02]
MKTMTCRQLGGACEQSFQGETLEEIIEQNKLHIVEMMMQQDEQHIEAARKVKVLMEDSEAKRAWFANKQQLFDELPED